jgi:hypothetical protein
MKLECRFVATACLVVCTAFGAARAESLSEQPSAPSSPEIPPRPWLYLDDPSVPAAMRAIVDSRATYTTGPSPTRPFGANLARPGGFLEMGGELGLVPHLSVAATVLGGGLSLGVGALAGLRWAPFESAWKTTHAVVSGGWLHELEGDDGAWLRLAITQDIERLRFGATVHGEHIFAGGRDPVDVLVMAGASCALAGPLRAGVEYVAQDLEESLGDQAEGGPRHFIGPQMALELLDKRLSLAGGPAFGIGPRSPTLSGRLSLAYEY